MGRGIIQGDVKTAYQEFLTEILLDEWTDKNDIKKVGNLMSGSNLSTKETVNVCNVYSVMGAPDGYDLPYGKLMCRVIGTNQRGFEGERGKQVVIAQLPSSDQVMRFVDQGHHMIEKKDMTQ